MLQSLYIKNFVLIEQLEIDFHPRMSVFTGETGAGKSIIIGALSMALGNRADTQAIGPFDEQSEIIAEFVIANNPSAHDWLQEQDLLNGDELIIRRTFNRQGRSKQWVNGRPTPSGMVKELSQFLVQIHGQHDQIRLLKNQNQLQILDQAGDFDLLLKQTQEAVKHIHAIEQQLEDLQAAGSMSHDQVQLLQYQFDELEQLALADNEYESLHQSLKTAAHAQELTQNIDDSIQRLSADDSSVEVQLGHIINKLKLAKGHDFSVVCQMLEESLINVNEAQNELQSVLEAIENNPDDLQQIESRIEQISHIARKQNVMPELLFQQHQDLSETLQTHADLAINQQKLNDDLDSALNKYRSLAAKLSTQRKKSAQDLSNKITTMIKQLGLPEAQFSIQVELQDDAKPKMLGNDHIEFMIAANKGQSAQPLNKTASGGELSRISLAIEVSTQQDQLQQAFIFDEVDTGIGGATAEKVGHIMQQLSNNNQVFAVTHLPQVAGHAHDHLLVSKSSQGKYTTSVIEHLSTEQRIQELARMSGGQNITDATLAQAKEFLKTG
ncbi:DNA repair protein RecN [Marinicella litoralis]|uniref:DNA repair protein RecN n=1 Tax=Marinicella litoralis TaxID=644220 RepID=A0A4R6XRA6_9GAMM|nr:DNA repair protein RecN [Marinicella litoralis]TDR22415.1 DNA replication and repair protein RecN [Marinicella litoralis]